MVLAPLVGALIVAGCGDDEGADGDPTSTTTTSQVATTSSSTTTAVPEREPSTTTTAFDPATVEGEVEAAYLRSWDVYADAVYHLELDEQALAEVYAEPHLSQVLGELENRIADGRSAHVIIEHRYEITVESPTQAHVVDQYTNHQRLMDPESKRYLEEDPNEVLLDVVTLNLIDGAWRVTQWQAVQ